MKRLTFVACVAAVLALALPARATTFIKDVMLIGGTLEETTSLTNSLVADGWTFVNYDLNRGCNSSTDYIFLLYKAEEGHGQNHGYITGFYIKQGASGVDSELTYGERTYHLTPYNGGSHFKGQKGDLNSNAGGDSIHLYYTKDFLADDNHAVTGVVFNDTKSGALGANGGSTGYDLNAGAGGDYVYMHVTTDAATLTVVLDGPSGEVTLEDGDVLTGTGTGVPYTNPYNDLTRVKIADGATVTLDSVTINLTMRYWGGITCLGDATIILAGTNTITAQNCGIVVPPDKTLRIRGDGSLIVSSSGYAGIGGGDSGSSCGNIIIEGGTVVATGVDGAGIGGNQASGTCGCGSITITDGVTEVTVASDGIWCPYSIGPVVNKNTLEHGSCGTVTIGGRVTGAISINPYTYRPSETTLSTVAFRANGGSGTMASQSFASNIPQTLNGNAFTRAAYDHSGWNTAADGSGARYGDGQTLFNAGNLTLYAQWTPITYGISYNLAGGTIADGNPSSYNVETATFTLNEPTRVGCTFAGWTWDGQSTPTKTVTIATGSSGDRSFTANWSNANPKSSFDVCSGGACDITVSGWAYDPDAPSMSLSVLVKVYKSDGTTLFREETLTADRPRNDVNSHYGITGQHGFSATIPDIPPGTYKVKAYAIDPSGDGNNPQIGSTKTAVVEFNSMTRETGTVTVFDGAVLTGTGGADTHILIADGATVTLSNATITAISTDSSHKWAGLTCLGDATIVLADGTANAVKGGGMGDGYTGTPGIYVPVGKTLTIRGTGSLVADGREDNGYFGYLGLAAGIGGGFEGHEGSHYEGIDCGNIVIAGGNISARGGFKAAGIGGGYQGKCGSITICGGTVAAYGGRGACAIGASSESAVFASSGAGCGDIAITEGVDLVTAVRGEDAPDYIGRSYNGSTCGTVTIYEGLGELYLGADTLQLYKTLILSDGADNAAVIAGKRGRLGNATLQGRTLCRNGGYWNALCLPFDMTAEQISEQLWGLCGLMTLHTATLGDGTLTLNFTSATAIEAGKPYLVRWPGGADLADPTFADVMVPAVYTNAEAIAAALAATSRKTDLVDFVGNFSPVSIAASDKTAFCLGDANTFSQPGIDFAVNSCRAYFRLKGGLRAGYEVKRCVLSLGGETITGALFASPYEAWTAASGISGAWDATDALGIANVFRYAFNKPTGAFANPPLLGISFTARGRPVITTPPLVNTAGFTFSVVASDNPDGTGDVDTTPLSASGKTTIYETKFAPARFFRLRAVEQ